MSDNDSQDDTLSDLFSDFDEVADFPEKAEPASKPVRKQGRSRRPAYRSALTESRTDRRQAARATGKQATLAGQYVRRSFTFRPEQLEQIEQLAAQLGLSQNDLVRWFTDMGIEAVGQGVRPPVSAEVRHRYDPDG